MKYLVPLAALFFLMLGGFTIIYKTNLYQDCLRNYQQEIIVNENSAIIICSSKVVDNHNGVVTALATLVIAVFTVVLANATTKQNDLTREALIADKRAFVYCTGVKQYYDKDTNSGLYNWRFRPVWNNSGDTPTKNMTMHTQCVLTNSQLSDDFNFNYPTTNIGTALIPPKNHIFGGLGPAPNQGAITPQDILDVQNGTKFLYFMGWAKYSDVFPKTPTHLTRFCWLILPNGNPLTFIPDDRDHSLLFESMHNTKGNCADNECDC